MTMNEQPLQRIHTAQHVGYDLSGRPVYEALPAPAPSAAPAVPLQPIQAHPWGAYIGLGCVGVLALTVVVVAIAFVVFGFAILAAVLALVVVVLTICVLVLRGMWRDYQRSG
jgi:hypothetical protein